MWIQDIGKVYTESNSYNSKLTEPGPIRSAGWSSPRETQNSLSYKGSFAMGGGDFGPKGITTFEQEESNKIIDIINKHLSSLDIKNPTDRVAIEVLAKIKKELGY